MEAEQAQTAAVQAHSLEAQAYAHAEAQAHTIAHVHSLEAQAHSHAQQVRHSLLDQHQHAKQFATAAALCDSSSCMPLTQSSTLSVTTV